ncbi:hypothetical protein HN51_036683 [Arachis hypogaea]|uniref:AT-hook motif nuclear-localized protein n=1 Tax=Arachis hypogaea TaxID=3818 RepID=A0A444ZYT0_ARAHY|nr:AT-hook motif nuclear-localized protein 5 [Arachis ipaensis]XP_025637329.1 AT-hook motif nuclear-localized protein 5 [Arachis hypogaea]QHO02096.1 AT-hook motif nuclear-localized protein [Arachis hypogaea]RYR19337.1 hypothetical protein Ahy_B03g064100 [Arachis hypogaea]
MDGREAMAFTSGSSSFYVHRESGGLQGPPGFRALSNTAVQSQSNAKGGGGGSVGSNSSFALRVQPQAQARAGFSHGIGIGASSSGGGVPPSSSGEPVKKKRGRPRKYGPEGPGPVSLRLSSMSAPACWNAGSTSDSQKRGRGRPPGSGRKQQLATLGEWMNSSAGLAFSPHVISIGVGEDIVAKLLSISQQRPRALCIMSGTGIVSLVTLRQPASTNTSVTIEGRFQILCLSGSYLVPEDGGPSNRTGGISVSLSSSDGRVIGGGVAVLIAGSPVQVVVCSFVYSGSAKTKPTQATLMKEESSEPQRNDKLASLASAPHSQNYIPSATGIWPGSRPADLKSAHGHTGIDLTRG